VGQRNAVDVLGVSFQPLTRRQAAEEIARLAKKDARSYVVKPYSEFMPVAAKDQHVRDILNGADLCLADGAGILWAAHYLSLKGTGLRAAGQLVTSLMWMLLRRTLGRGPLPEAMAGVDLTWEMLGALEEAGATVFLLGGSVEESDRARRNIEARLPGLRVVGSRPGHFNVSGKENEQVIAAINAAVPDTLLVAMGFPRQEKWIAKNLPQLNVHVAVAEGGSFTFIAGNVPRAPEWMRRSGLEWAFRLGRQPWRLKRQLALPQFVWLMLRKRLSRA
jgi:N-acetylglucosaminyldiphosphoundecaprenol N-acetyl-beta-D-mannosaminyltransferase